MRLTLSYLMHAPFHSYKYQGGLKNLTKNCPECRWYVELAPDKRRCYGGKYWQGPTEHEKPRNCELFGENRPERLHDIEGVMQKFTEDLRHRIEKQEIDMSEHNMAYRNRAYDWNSIEHKWELRIELNAKYGRLVLISNDPLEAFFGEEIFEGIHRMSRFIIRT